MRFIGDYLFTATITTYDLTVLPDAEFGTQLTILLSLKMVEMPTN